MARLPETLREYLDDGMRLAHKTAVDVERETGVPAQWTRQFKAGRMKERPNADYVAKVVAALNLDATTVWTYLGRLDRVAALRTGEELEAVKAPGLTETLQALLAELAAVREERANQVEATLAQVDAIRENTAMLADVLAQLTGQPPVDPRAAAAIQAQADAAPRTSPLPQPDPTTGTTGR